MRGVWDGSSKIKTGEVVAESLSKVLTREQVDHDQQQRGTSGHVYGHDCRSGGVSASLRASWTLS